MPRLHDYPSVTPDNADVGVLERETAPASGVWQSKKFTFANLMNFIRANNPLSANGVTPGTYGSSTRHAVVAVDIYGRITSATDVVTSGGGGSDTDMGFLGCSDLVAGAPYLSGSQGEFEIKFTSAPSPGTGQYYETASMTGQFSTPSVPYSGFYNTVLEFTPTVPGEKFLLEAYINAQYDGAGPFSIWWDRFDSGTLSSVGYEVDTAATVTEPASSSLMRMCVYTGLIITAAAGKTWRLCTNSTSAYPIIGKGTHFKATRLS